MMATRGHRRDRRPGGCRNHCETRRRSAASNSAGHQQDVGQSCSAARRRGRRRGSKAARDGVPGRPMRRNSATVPAPPRASHQTEQGRPERRQNAPSSCPVDREISRDAPPKLQHARGKEKEADRSSRAAGGCTGTKIRQPDHLSVSGQAAHRRGACIASGTWRNRLVQPRAVLCQMRRQQDKPLQARYRPVPPACRRGLPAPCRLRTSSRPHRRAMTSADSAVQSFRTQPV